ncbi:MAG: heavy metal translocating P-type ATPase [Leptothrix sp. (in: b-proteobacteria)]
MSATQVAAVDAETTLQACTQWQDGADGQRHGRSRLLLSGLHCAACAGLIEDALRRVDGVHSAEVSGAAQRAVVVWDPLRTRFSALIEAVRRAGYGAFPDTGAEAVTLAARESRQATWRLFVAAFCMMQVMMYAAPTYWAAPGDMAPDLRALLHWASWVLSVPVLLFAAGPFFRGAWRALRERRIGMDVPVALGIAVTFVASSVATFDPARMAGTTPAGDSGIYFDSLTMFVAFLLGARLLESRAKARAAQALDAVMRRLPDAVERIGADGQAQRVTPAELNLDDVVRVQVGQAFAADGVVLDGHTEVDESMLSGEFKPVERRPGDAVAAGCLNLGAPVHMRVTGLGAQTRYQRIVELVERTLTERPAWVVGTDRLAAPFLWAVLLLAAGAFVAWQFIDPARALWVAVSVLIVTCPCALSLGAPVTLLAATGALARRGVLVQRLDALEVLTRVQHLVFDKTGTLTDPSLSLAGIDDLRMPDAHQPDTDLPAVAGLHALAASLAVQSTHPLAQALVASRPADGVAPSGTWHRVREQAGQGLEADWHDPSGRFTPWRLGRLDWVSGSAASATDTDRTTPAVHPLPSAQPSVWLGCPLGGPSSGRWQAQVAFRFDEALRADAASGVAALVAAGLQVHLLSGDQAASVAGIAARLHIATHLSACTPQDKLDAVAHLQAGGACVAMVGDGINDAPVLARADVSVAMGSAAALAQARADVIVLSNRIGDIATLFDTARRARRVVRQNLGWALVYNLACVPLALAGWLPPWLAGLGMALSSLAVVLNGLRLARNNGAEA